MENHTKACEVRNSMVRLDCDGPPGEGDARNRRDKTRVATLSLQEVATKGHAPKTIAVPKNRHQLPCSSISLQKIYQKCRSKKLSTKYLDLGKVDGAGCGHSDGLGVHSSYIMA